MTTERANGHILTELHLLVAQGLLDREQLARIATRYPSGRWDVRALVRWFTIAGVVAMVLGLVLLAPRLFDTRNLIDGGLALAALAALAMGLRLRSGRPATAAALQLGGGLLIQGFTLSFASHHATGSDNWPALVGLDAVVLLGLAYGLRNRLVLVHACVTLFVWFGGSTGYASGWGVYWLNMSYPLRFALAGLVALAIAYGHHRFSSGPLQSFSRVWAHFGLLVINLSLWFFALFGYFGGEPNWDGNTGQRLAFSLLWAGASAGSLLAGSRLGLSILRGYGLVFLIIDLYTFYFQFVVANSQPAWFLHLLIGGGSLLALGVWLEARRKRAHGTTS